MTKPIRATRENLKPGTIWQNAAGTKVIGIHSCGKSFLFVEMFEGRCTMSKTEILATDVLYQVQPIKENASDG